MTHGHLSAESKMSSRNTDLGVVCVVIMRIPCIKKTSEEIIAVVQV